MNVKAGDRARVVNTRTPNDGAIVEVIEPDAQWTRMMGKPVWAVRGVQMLGFALDKPIPKTIQEEGVIPDANLRRVESSRDAIDRRQLVDDDTVIPLSEAVRRAVKAMEA
ncbi:hypothetical protein [Paraburkholderia tropica]|uniref:hypothetical protein n=1 Tax=Paraburkholderia tropica TaxID=92647 RepID=UPI00160A1D53|nr:hypothetical protein [Paraburkholderia tropica]MBB2981778.1 hypothetical protein [Paraburkholderia tropica]